MSYIQHVPDIVSAIALHCNGYDTETYAWYTIERKPKSLLTVRVFCAGEEMERFSMNDAPEYTDLAGKRLYAPNRDELFYKGAQCLPRTVQMRDYAAAQQMRKEATSARIDAQLEANDRNALRDAHRAEIAMRMYEPELLTWQASTRREGDNYIASYKHERGHVDTWHSMCTDARHSEIDALCALWVMLYENGAKELKELRIVPRSYHDLFYRESALAIVQERLARHRDYLANEECKQDRFNVDFLGDSGDGINLRGCDLRKADIGGTLSGASLEGANLSGTNIDMRVKIGLYAQEANFTGATVRITVVDCVAYFNNTNFNGANLDIKRIKSDVYLSDCTFDGATLCFGLNSGLHFGGADFVNAILEGSLFTAHDFDTGGAKNIFLAKSTSYAPAVAVVHRREGKEVLMVRHAHFWGALEEYSKRADAKDAPIAAFFAALCPVL